MFLEEWKYYAGWLVVACFAVGMGILSFAGLIALTPSVALGCASFVFTAAIVGSVYKRSILQGIERLCSPGYTAREHIRDALIAYYDYQIKHKKRVYRRTENYLKDYLTIMALDNQHHLAPEGLEKKEELQRDCKAYEIAMVKAIQEGKGLPHGFTKEQCDSIRRTMCLQIYVASPCALLFASLAGLSMFTVIVGSAAGTQGAIVSIMALFSVTVGTSAAVASGVGIAVLAAVPFAFAIYHTLMGMFNHQKIIAWKKRFTRYLNNTKVSRFKQIALVVVVVLAVALTITATVLTAGGWWHAAIAGAKVLTHVGAKAQPIIQALAKITVPFYALAFFSFSITHSVSSMTRFVKDAVSPFRLLVQRFRAYYKKNGLAQTLNPFVMVMLMVSVPLKITIFLLHNISEALVNVKVGGGKGVLSAIFIAADDAATEANEVFSGHSHMHLDLEEPIHGILKGQRMADFINEKGHGCEHGPLDAFVYLSQVAILLPLHLPAALWDWSIGNLFRSHPRAMVKCFQSIMAHVSSGGLRQ